MKSDTFGLEIRTDIMRALWFKREKDLLTLGGLSQAVPPPSGIVSEATVDQHQIAQAIRILLMHQIKLRKDFYELSIMHFILAVRIVIATLLEPIYRFELMLIRALILLFRQ